MSTQDEDLLDRALAGLLDGSEERDLAERLKAEPVLARRLIELSREEALLADEVAGRRALVAEARRPFRRTWMIGALAAAVLIGLAILLARPGEPEIDDYTAVAVEVEGEASVRIGDRLNPGASLRTGADARVRLRYPDRTTLDVGARSEAALRRRGPSREIGLDGGSLTARVSPLPPGETFHFVTPHAEARVLGTELSLSVDRDSTRLEVAEGKVVLIRGEGGPSAEVPSGHFAQTRGKEIVTGPLQGAGLRAEYFDNEDFTVLRVSRVDPAVNFDWGLEAPFPSLDADHFSVRWTGQVEPRHSETYEFHVVSDDGARLWVDGQLIVDDWTVRGTRERTGTIELLSGRRYDLKLEYFERVHMSNVKLLWSSPSQPREVIPRSQLHPDAGR